MDFVGKTSTASRSTAAPASDMAVEIGSGRLIPGFEDQLVGVKTGDEKQINVTFPEDYSAEDAGGQARDVRPRRSSR